MQNTQQNDLLSNTIKSSVQTFFCPKERMTVSQAAEKYRILSTVSARSGRWQTLSFQRELMDAFNDPKIERIYIESGTQLGKTETIINTVLWIVLFDPSPILIVCPRDADAKKFSQRIRDMIEMSPVLQERFTKQSKADVQNVYTLSFRGGAIYFAHAGSSASLAMMPVKYLFCDEIDKEEYYKNLNNEGTALKLAEARTDNFELTGRKIIYTCSPTTDKGNIHQHYLKGDQRRFNIPCKSCGEYFEVKFNENIVWDKDESVKPSIHHSNTARIVCPNCKHEMPEKDRLWAIDRGKYIATAETRNIASFNIPSIYSPLRRLSTLVDEFIDCKRSGKIQTFYNTKLAECLTIKGESFDPLDLYRRKETYAAQVPAECGVLIAAADIQVDRIEVGVWGFGRNDEMWLIDYAMLNGDPFKPEVWQALTEFRNNTYEHESGNKVRIKLTAIDAGDKAKEVLDYCSKYSSQCVPIRGNPKPQLTLAQRSKNAAYPVWWIATDIAKDIIFDRYKVAEHGARYIHLPEWITQDNCAQLTGEERKEVKRAGLTTTRWTKRTHSQRVEWLDIMVYCIAIFDASVFSHSIDSILSALVPVELPSENNTQPQAQQIKQRGHKITVRNAKPY